MSTPDHLAEALDALALTRPRYELADAYAQGTISEVFSSQRLRDMIGPTGYRYRVNFARTPIDVLLERTTINGITCSDAAAVTLLEAVWDDNELGLEAKDLHKLAYTYGDSYLIAWPNDDLPGGVEAYCHDPLNVRVFYDPQQPRRKSHAVHTWLERGSEANGLGEGLWKRVALYYPDYVEQWVTRHRIDAAGVPGQTLLLGQDEEYVPYRVDGSDENGVIDNPTPGIVPVFHFRNARPYGRPEHEDAYGPQDMINKLNITMMASVDFAGFPQRYVLTDSALNPSQELDNFGPPPDGSLTTDGLPGVEEGSTLRAGPGETWFLSGAKLSVGQFSVSETSNFLTATESLIKQMASVCDIPSYYFDRSGQMPSGESFRRAEAPLNKKLDDRLAMFGVTWHEFFDYCLGVNGRPSADAFLAFDPPEVYSDTESWQAALLQQQAGVTREQTLLERGYSADLIDKMISSSPAPTVMPPEVP